MRKIIYAVLFLAVVGGISWVFLQMKNEQAKAPDAIHALPDNAISIFQFRPGYWGEFSNVTSILADLISEEEFPVLNTMITELDSVRLTSPAVQEILDNGAFYLSFHQVGNEERAWLFTCALLPTQNELSIQSLIENVSGSPFSKSIYDEINIWKSDGFQYSIVHGKLVLCANEMLFQEAVRHLNREQSILNDTAFAKAFHSAGETAVNLWTIENIDNQKHANDNTWSALELNFENGELRIIGYDQNQANQWAGKKSVTETIDKFVWQQIPSNAYNIQISVPGELGEYLASLPGKLANENDYSDYMERISELEISCVCNVTKTATNGGKSFGHFYAQDHEYSYVEYEEFETSFDEFAKLIGDGGGPFKSFPILQLRDESLYQELFQDERFQEKSWFVPMENILVFASSEEAIKSYLNQIIAGRSLINNNAFGDIMEKVNSDSHEFYYESSKGGFESKLWPLDFSSSDIIEKLMWRKTHEEGKTYNHLFGMGTEVEKADGGPLWEFPLEANLSSRPWLVKNHYSGTKEVFVQDNENRIYLISSSGKKLWDRKMESKILSDIEQIDIFKNGKLQMIFNTSNKIYCLDRNGNDVDGFPINLPSKATSKLAVFDYDNTLDYRLVIACTDKSLRNYRIDGSKTKGWKYKSGESNVTQLDHLRIKGKDYIFALEESGSIHLLKRNGKPRYETEARAEHCSGNGVSFVIEDKISESQMIYSDSTGNIVMIQFNQATSETGLTGFSQGSSLLMADINNDRQKDYLIVDGEELKVFDDRSSRLFSMNFQSDISGDIGVYKFTNVDSKIGIHLEESQEIFLLDSEGNIEENFPLKGSTEFSISDIDLDGRFELLVGMDYGAVVIYRLN